MQIVTSSQQAAVNVDEVKLPNGKVMKQKDCFAIIVDNDRDDCMGVFTAVTDCGLDNPDDAAEAKTCVKEAISEWFELNYKEQKGILGLGMKAAAGFPEPVVDDGGDDGGSFEDEGDDTGEGGFEGEADKDETDSGSGSGSADKKGEEKDEEKPDGSGAGGFEELGEDEEVDAAPK